MQKIPLSWKLHHLMCAGEGGYFEKNIQSRENQAKIYSIAKKYSKKSETLIREIVEVKGE